MIGKVEILRGKLRDKLSRRHLHQVPVDRLAQLNRIQLLLDIRRRLHLLVVVMLLLVMMMLPRLGRRGSCLDLLYQIALRGHDERGGRRRELHLPIPIDDPQQLLRLPRLYCGLSSVPRSTSSEHQRRRGQLIRRLPEDELNTLWRVLLHEHRHLVRGHDQLMRLRRGQQLDGISTGIRRIRWRGAENCLDRTIGHAITGHRGVSATTTTW